MKRFSFPLQTVLDMRKRTEDGIKEELGHKNREITEAQQRLVSINEALVELHRTEKVSRQERLIISSLGASVAWRFKLRGDIATTGRLIQDLQNQAEAIRQRLIEAKRAVRAIELVREKRLKQWKKEYSHEVQGFIDDVSQQGYIRAQRLQDAT